MLALHKNLLVLFYHPLTLTLHSFVSLSLSFVSCSLFHIQNEQEIVILKQNKHCFSEGWCPYLFLDMSSPDDSPTPASRTYKASLQPLQTFSLYKYMEETWIAGRTWIPLDWPVYGVKIRTNNELEGWHTRFNHMCNRANSQFYLLVDLLVKESRLVKLQAQLGSI